MIRQWFFHKVCLLIILLAALFSLTACQGAERAQEPGFPSTEFVSSTELFRLYVPTGWSTEEVIPGAGLVMANNETALARYRNGNALEAGELVLNVGFLPLALFQEKELSHLDFQFEAQPDEFLQSLLPMFRFGQAPASSTAGEAILVSLGKGRDAGRLTFSEERREGLLLFINAGDNVFAFISATTLPGGLGEFQESILEVAAGVAYTGSQDALYSKLYGD